MTTNILYSTPRVTAFNHILRNLNRNVQYKNAYGQVTGFPNLNSNKSMEMSISYMALDVATETTKYLFAAEETELCSVDTLMERAGIVDIDAIWETAFDAAKELFDSTKDDPSLATIGVPFYLRAEMITANFGQPETMGVNFYIGVYRDEEFQNMTYMFEMKFVSQAAMATRNANIARLQSKLAVDELKAAGNHPTQVAMTEEELAQSKAVAANEVISTTNSLNYETNALVGPMSAVLGLPAVQSAFDSVTRAAFSEFHDKLEGWENIDVDLLMSFFGAALMEVINS